MAHMCCECGSECYCNGDIDDVVTTTTHINCRGCGCDIGFDDNEDDDWDIIGYECVGCEIDCDNPGICPICNSPLQPY